MKFVPNLTKEKYIDFYNKSKYSTLLQSYEWGEFCITGKNQTPYYVGVVDDKGKVIGTSLLLKHKLRFGKYSFYAPRGFNLDFNNKELLSFFTKELINFMQKENVVFLEVDPEIMYQELDNEANIIENGKNNKTIHEYLLSLGYKHKGFNKLYENNQPRYTFIIDLTTNYEERMNKSFLKNINRASKYDLEVSVGDYKDLEAFYELYKKTAERDDFDGYSPDYYNKFYEVFAKSKMTKIFLGKVYPKKILNNLELELREVNESLKEVTNENKKDILLKRQEKLFKEMELFNKYKDYKDGLIASAHIMAFYQDKVVALYAGNDKEFQSTYINNYVYYEKIKWAKENGYKSLDLFGVTGDPNTKYKNLAGIYEFKKQLGGNLIEYIGEYDLVANKFYYHLFKIITPIYRKLKRIIKK